MSKVDSVTIRMYNTGSVGDCILYLFKKGNTISFKMLIDCGGWNTKEEFTTPCVNDIAAICNNELDLLIVTHQHEDHVSGFNQAKTAFNKIAVKQVWMSWIEDKTDEIAKILKTKYGKTLAQAKTAALSAQLKLKTSGSSTSKVRGLNERFKKRNLRMEETMNLLQLEDGIPAGKTLAAKQLTNNDAMEYVRKKGKDIKYLKPGEVIAGKDGAEGMKFFILGPPRDADMKFFKIAIKEEEMYHLAARSASVEPDLMAGESILESGIRLAESSSPFSERYHMDKKQQAIFFKEYNGEDLEWRQIESDWLESAASIALRVNTLTNNTSLAMAIEFENSGRVLLLPADAQSGNWMGWHKPDVMQSLKDAGGKDTVELLKNTVFYKVGHHGSHNGTASVSGLEFVKSKDLVAFMPLVQDKVPKEWGGAANFPAQALYNVIIDKTKGRLVRTDEGIVKSSRAKKLRDLLSAGDKKKFEDSFKKGSCYMEYTVKG